MKMELIPAVLAVLRRKVFVISTDPVSGGDLRCGETIPDKTLLLYSVFFVLWVITTIVIFVNNWIVRRNTFPFFVPNDQHAFIQPMYSILPMIRVVSLGATAICMLTCERANFQTFDNSLMKYVMMIQITGDTIFWTLFFVF